MAHEWNDRRVRRNEQQTNERLKRESKQVADGRRLERDIKRAADERRLEREKVGEEDETIG